MIGIFPRFLNFVGYRFINVAATLDSANTYPPDEHSRYIREDPYESCRVTYPLTSKSLVVDVGGLTGDWAARIYCLYSCRIDVYEPHPELSKRASMNFLSNPNVRVHDYGLGGKSEKLFLYGDSADASVYNNSSASKTRLLILKASEVFNTKYQNGIDLLKMNVEGAEYDILPDLLANYDMTKIKNIQIQFHRNVPDYSMKRDAIRRDLSKTHIMDWCYDYIFENWTLKK